jgi:hypothetical protein
MAGLDIFVIAHKTSQYGFALYAVTAHCQAYYVFCFQISFDQVGSPFLEVNIALPPSPFGVGEVLLVSRRASFLARGFGTPPRGSISRYAGSLCIRHAAARRSRLARGGIFLFLLMPFVMHFVMPFVSARSTSLSRGRLFRCAATLPALSRH